MHNENQNQKIPSSTNYLFHKGQSIIYHGEKANVLTVRPVFTIRIKNRCEIICGDTLLNEISPYRN